MLVLPNLYKGGQNTLPETGTDPYRRSIFEMQDFISKTVSMSLNLELVTGNVNEYTFLIMNAKTGANLIKRQIKASQFIKIEGLNIPNSEDRLTANLYHGNIGETTGNYLKLFNIHIAEGHQASDLYVPHVDELTAGQQALMVYGEFAEVTPL